LLLSAGYRSYTPGVLSSRYIEPSINGDVTRISPFLRKVANCRLSV
jgi:hypothetical protein